MQREGALERMRRQLRESSEQYELQAGELKAANLSLQAANEELINAVTRLGVTGDELRAIIEQLYAINQSMAGCAERMVELKSEVDELRAKLGLEPKYAAELGEE